MKASDLVELSNTGGQSPGEMILEQIQGLQIGQIIQFFRNAILKIIVG